VWIRKKGVNNVEKRWVSRLTVCGFKTTCLALFGVETYKGEVKTAFAAFVMWIQYLLVSI
jgi:hypothetical protein